MKTLFLKIPTPDLFKFSPIRHFQLYLRPNYRIFSSGFKVRSVDRHGNLKEHEVDRTEYYQGVMGGKTR